MDNPYRFIAVVGPTASGKSLFAHQLAQKIGGEIVCCDSVQLYTGFDIGSAKPSLEDQAEVVHHLFDWLNWNDECDAALYANKAQEVISEINSRGKTPIVTGGTGLYFRALIGDQWDENLPKDEKLRQRLNLKSSEELFEQLTALDPRRAGQLHMNDRFRVIRALEIITLTGKPVSSKSEEPSSKKADYKVIVLDPPRPVLHERIFKRTQEMVEKGLIEEVEGLLNLGVSPDSKPMNSIGYAETNRFLKGEINKEQLFELILAATRQYAKRQCTWFKKVHRDETIS